LKTTHAVVLSALVTLGCAPDKPPAEALRMVRTVALTYDKAREANRYFGTVTAYVPGPEAARFHFTSALPVRVTGLLMSTLDRLSSPAPAAPKSLSASASR